MAMPQLPPSFHRPEIPQRKLPRRLIDYLRFGKVESFRSLTMKIGDEGRLESYHAFKRENDHALSKVLASWHWSAEAIENEPNPMKHSAVDGHTLPERRPQMKSGFRVCRAKSAFALRVKRALKQYPKDEWVEAFLDQLRVTVNRRRLLSMKFRRLEFRKADILGLTNGKLKAIVIARYVRRKILHLVNRLP